MGTAAADPSGALPPEPPLRKAATPLAPPDFALGLEEGSALAESLGDVQAVFVTDDYSLHYAGYQ